MPQNQNLNLFPHKNREPLSTYGEKLVNAHFIDAIVHGNNKFAPNELYCMAYTAYLLSQDAGTCTHFRELMDHFRSSRKPTKQEYQGYNDWKNQ